MIVNNTGLVYKSYMEWVESVGLLEEWSRPKPDIKLHEKCRVVVEAPHSVSQGIKISMIKTEEGHYYAIDSTGLSGNDKRIHYDMIIAWANGDLIQMLGSDGKWLNTDNPCWHKTAQYRITPTKAEIRAKIKKLEEELRDLD